MPANVIETKEGINVKGLALSCEHEVPGLIPDLRPALYP